MKHSTPKPSKDDLRRFDKLYRIGCIACRIHEMVYRYPEIHHLNLGGKAGQKRRGHQFTIPLCSWHHQGTVDLGWNSVEMVQKHGPSLAKQSRRFREVFGSDDELLEQTARLIEEGKI